MTDNNQINVKEYILLNIAILLLTAISSLLGIQTIIGPVFIAALLMVVIIRTRLVFFLVCAALMQTTTMAVSGNADVVMLINTLPVALGMGYAYKNKKNLLWILSCGVLGYMVSAGILYALSNGQNFSFFISQTRDYLDNYIQLMSENNNMTVDLQKAYYEYIMSMMPSTLIIMSISFLYITFLMAKTIVIRLDAQYNYFKRFLMMKADKVSTIVYLIAFLTSFFDMGQMGTVMFNLRMLLSGYLTLCGLAVLIFYIRKVRALGIKIALCVLCLVAPALLVTVGIIDAWRDMRRIDGGSEVS